MIHFSPTTASVMKGFRGAFNESKWEWDGMEGGFRNGVFLEMGMIRAGV